MKNEGTHAEPWSATTSSGEAITLGADLFCDGRAFDPTRIDAYLAGFGIARSATDSTAGRDVPPSSAREATSS